MNPKFSIPLVCLLLLAGLTPLNGQGLIFQKDITVERNEIEDNVISLGGTIWVKGEVKQSVIAIGGKIIIEGKVGDTVFGFGTDIELTSSAVVDGDVATIGGQLDKHLEAVVRGDTVTLSFDTPEFLKDIFAGGWGGLITIILIAKLISLVFWFIFAVILAAAFPRQTSLASSQIRNNFWPTFGIGLLCIIIFTGAVIFSAFLALVLIGIPIIITLATVGIAVKIFRPLSPPSSLVSWWSVSSPSFPSSALSFLWWSTSSDGERLSAPSLGPGKIGSGKGRLS
jgi:hypothetical protein